MWFLAGVFVGATIAVACLAWLDASRPADSPVAVRPIVIIRSDRPGEPAIACNRPCSDPVDCVTHGCALDRA